MKTSLILTFTMGVAAGGLAVRSTSAMPMSGPGPALAAPAGTAKTVESIRWICGPYGNCRWVPGWRRGWWRGGPWWGYRYGNYDPWRPHWGWGPWGYRYYW